MFDRLRVLVGAGLAVAWIAASVFTGAGTAVASTDSEGGAGGDTSAEDSPVGTSSATENAEVGVASADDEDSRDAVNLSGASVDEPAPGDLAGNLDDVDLGSEASHEDEDVDLESAKAPDPENRAEHLSDPDSAAAVRHGEDVDADRSPPSQLRASRSPRESAGAAPAEREALQDVIAVTTVVGSAVAPSLSARPVTAVVTDRADSTTSAPGATHPATSFALTTMKQTANAGDAINHAGPPARQTLLSLLGTIVFNVYGGLIRVLGGPPQLPGGSTVTVRSSTLEIDCGEGYDVPADWYVPAGPTPQRLVYLQHGFLAAGPFYSYTAARLAESTNSIVVTTSLTSNFLACDGCWLGGSPMHRAVADLFADGNTALAESALAAGYSATLLDGVEQVALTGHSLGGGLVAGTAGYMVGNGSVDRLAGVVMLDGVGFGSVVPDALAALPDDVPIYNLAARSYFWNMSGASNEALGDARPDQFVGVRLVDGLHSDTMLGGNPLVQFALYLVTGFSREQNIDAAEILNAAWLNDMFTGQTAAPYYGRPGELLRIDTPRGTATAYVTPGPAERLSLIDHLFTFGANILFGIDLATCADEPAENVPFSGPDTLLSLDGRTKPGQSIAQHVCTG